MSRGPGELLTGERQGVLATVSARRAGWPFASVTPFALSAAGEPLLLLSDLAEHTRNIRADPRVSLLVQDGSSAEDPQAGARVTLLGVLEPVSSAEIGAAQTRYVHHHPQAAEYLSMTDFHLYVLRVSEARFIGGFGDMGWIDGQTLRAEINKSKTPFD